MFIGSELGINFQDAKTISGQALYFEILAFDREIASSIANTRSLNWSDILTLGPGIKISF